VSHLASTPTTTNNATCMYADVDVDKDGALDLKELYLVGSPTC
jgi:hypothetical protein